MIGLGPADALINREASLKGNLVLHRERNGTEREMEGTGQREQRAHREGWWECTNQELEEKLAVRRKLSRNTWSLYAHMLHPNSKQDEKHKDLMWAWWLPKSYKVSTDVPCTPLSHRGKRIGTHVPCTQMLSHRWLNCFHQIVGQFQLLRERFFLI